MAQLSNEDFYQKWVPLLADNEFQAIDGARLEQLVADLRDTFPSVLGLNVRQVKGASYPVPYTDALGTIPAAYRVLGMLAVARNGQTQAAAKGNAPQPPVTFQLVANAGGDVAALNDEQPGTVATTPAVWVQVSGSPAQIVDSFPALVLKNADGTPHPYNAGDKVKYVFPNGTARLFEVRAYLKVASNPLPTGLDADPAYRPFAPLLVSGGVASLPPAAIAVPSSDADFVDFVLSDEDMAAAKAGQLRAFYFLDEVAPTTGTGGGSTTPTTGGGGTTPTTGGGDTTPTTGSSAYNTPGSWPDNDAYPETDAYPA